MNSLMSLPIYLVEKLGQEEMLLVRGGIEEQESSPNNEDGRCSGTNNHTGRLMVLIMEVVDVTRVKLNERR